MLEQIISSLKGELLQKFTGGEQGIAEDKVDDAVGLAKDNMMETVKDEAGRGNINGLLDLFKDKQNVAGNPVVSHMITKYAGDLGSKLGLEPNMAQTIANFAIPFLLKRLMGKAEEQGMNQQSIMAILGGGMGDDVGNMLKDKFGGALGGFFK